MSADSKRVRLVMGRSPHFRELPAASLDRLASMARIERYKGGELIHPAWQPVTRLWIVLKGAVRCTMPAPDGNSFLVGVMNEGGFYGVAALLPGEFAADVDAHVIGPTDLAAIEIERLKEQAARDAPLERHLLRLVGLRMRAAIALYRDAVTATLPARVARRLLSHAVTAGREADGAGIELRFSQAELSAMLGASRSKVAAELRRLEAAGALTLGYRVVVIRDLARLSQAAGTDVIPI